MISSNEPLPDSSETLQISSLALLKMLKHARQGIPLEVMGLLLGEFVDEFTIRIVDVFSMPQTGSSVTVEAVDYAFQSKMIELLLQTGREELIVGWYHSHPGFGCWLSNIDLSTQNSFEMLNKRSVAVVIDPIQSVRGKVVLDAFRSIPPEIGMSEPREVTSNIGYYNVPTPVATIHGLNRAYYNFNIQYEKTEIEEKMLLNLNKKSWIQNLKINPLKDKSKKMKELSENYLKMEKEIKKLDKNQLSMYKIGKLDFRNHLLDICEETCNENTIHRLKLAIHRKILGR